jgi:hypothetical protein
MSDKLEWWGYKHNCGSYQAKRYFSQLDITEAQESPFVTAVVGPFMASSREDALEKVKTLIDVEPTDTKIDDLLKDAKEKCGYSVPFNSLLDWAKINVILEFAKSYHE